MQITWAVRPVMICTLLEWWFETENIAVISQCSWSTAVVGLTVEDEF